jgi:hypothetical protein
MKFRRLVSVGLAFVLGLACGCGGSDSAGDDAREAPPTPPVSNTDFRVSTKAMVTVADGGTLRLPDGSTLAIPAGAVGEDTEIEFSTLADQRTTDRGRYFEVKPSMQLAKPATLTMPAPAGLRADHVMWAFDSSPSAKLVDKGSEATRWNPAKVVESAPGTVAIETMHFTGFAVLSSVHDSGYLVVDVPAKYLEPGDILITLSAEHPIGDTTGTPNWFPGHVGVFLGPDAFAPGESVLGPDGQISNAAGAPNIVESVQAGVRNGSVDAFRTGFHDDHLYLGPRRPQGLTSSDKQKLIQYTLDQRGKGYNLVGDAANFLPTVVGGATLNQLDAFQIGGKSCVGLADAALAHVGRSPVSAVDRHVIAVTPVDMYHATGPVTTMTTIEGDDVSIPIYGVVVDPRSRADKALDGFYTRLRTSTSGAATSDYDITVDGLPPGASFTPGPNGYVFDWKAAYANSPVRLKITMTYHSRATKSDGTVVSYASPEIKQDLTIYVRPFSLGPIKASFNPETRSTVYTLQVNNPTKEFVNVTWSGPTCGSYSPMGLGPDSFEERVTSTMTWFHPHPPCPASTEHDDVTITALVHTKYGSATCTYQGASSGTGPTCRFH